MAILIKSTGEEIAISPANDKYFKLKELQHFVGGYIETLRIYTNQLMVVNEEGKLMKLPVNKRATGIAFENSILDVIVGDVLVCFDHEIR